MKQDHPSSSPPDASDLNDLAAQAHQTLVEKQARMQALQQRRPAPRWFRVGGLGTAIVCGAFLLWYAQSQAPAPTEAQLDRGRVALIGLISASLAEQLRSSGNYPDRLEQALPLPSDMQVNYRRLGSGYELEIRGRNGQIMTLRHG